MSTSPYPVRVDATLQPQLSRWLWLVKWLLAIPHYIVLAFLWLAFLVLSLFALVAIVVTGRYPQSIFEFNVGVLRWSWRVAYYAYGGLGTDHYPPFSLADVPDYPARLEVDYPQHLSRGLALVKWWLLAIPHYLVLAFFLGGGWYVASGTANDSSPALWGGGLIGLMVVIAAVVLLFTGRYPQSIFDLVLGMNRWVLRVAAYVALMTDEYPPFRLDMGGADPAGRMTLPGGSAVTQVNAPVSAPAPSHPGASPSTSRPDGRWSAGRVITVVLATVVFLLAGGLLTAGATIALAGATLRDDQGYLMSGYTTLSTPGAAVVSESLRLRSDASSTLPRRLLGDAKVRVRAPSGTQVFVGLAPSREVAPYLSGVAYSTVVDPAPAGADNTPTYRYHAGGTPAEQPGQMDIWATSASGPGTQVITWPVETGDWTLVVMNQDGSRSVAADVAVGATVPVARWVAAGLGVAGALLMVLSVGLFVAGLHRRAGPA